MVRGQQYVMDDMHRKAPVVPPPSLPLIGGGAQLWCIKFVANSINPSPYQGEARWGFRPLKRTTLES